MPDLDFKTIGQKIKARRQSVNITQEVMANYLDVNQSHISNIECGRANPSLTLLIQIANILGCSMDCFIDHEYSYQMTQDDSTTIDNLIMEKLKYCDATKKEKILKIMDILYILIQSSFYKRNNKLLLMFL